jgi:hypothetical protein
VALGGTSVNMNLESTPLAEDGFLYVVDQWGVLYKIDGRSGDAIGLPGARKRAEDARRRGRGVSRMRGVHPTPVASQGRSALQAYSSRTFLVKS